MAATTHPETGFGPMEGDPTGSADAELAVAKFGALFELDREALLQLKDSTPDLRKIVPEEEVDDLLKRFAAVMGESPNRFVGRYVFTQRPGVKSVDKIRGHGSATIGTAFTVIDCLDEHGIRQVHADVRGFYHSHGSAQNREHPAQPLDRTGFEEIVKAVALAEAVDSMDRDRTIAIIKTGKTALAS